MSRLENHRTSGACALHLQPPSGTYTPAITRFEPWKTKLWHRRRKVVPQFSRNPQELFGNHAAHRMHPEVFRTCLTASVAVEAGYRLVAAQLYRLSQNVPLDRTVRHFHGWILNGTAETVSRPLSSPVPPAPMAPATDSPRGAEPVPLFRGGGRSYCCEAAAARPALQECRVSPTARALCHARPSL